MKTKQKQIKTASKSKTSTRKASLSHPKDHTIHRRVRSHAKRVLVPHKENEYRPYLIRGQGLIAVLIIALLAQVSYGFVTTGQLSVLGRVSDIRTTGLFEGTNAERSKAGLNTLAFNEQLSQAAFMKAQNMFEEQYWAHVSPTGDQPWKWFGDVGYNYSFAGENLAKNYPTAKATVDAWMTSSAHRENLLKAEYRDVGFAVVDGTLDGSPTTLVVAFYGTPVTMAAVESALTDDKVSFAAPLSNGGTVNPLLNFGSALGTLSPVTIGILGLFTVVALVGVAAHHYRKYLPKTWKNSWRVHHGMYTFVGMILFGVLLIIGSSGGAI